MMIKGKAWILGDHIDTDLLAPGYAMKLPPEELAKHTLEAVNPDFASLVAPGDILVTGKNFGIGSSREQAAISLKTLGVGAILAKSCARIFFRNAMNVGLPVLLFQEQDMIGQNDRLSIDPLQGEIHHELSAHTFRVAPIPSHLIEMLAAGGLMPHLKQKLVKERAHAAV